MTESTAISAASGRRRTTLFLALFVASALLAFRALSDFDPDAGIRATVTRMEGWLFSPTGRSPFLIFGLTVLIVWGRLPRLRAAIRAGEPQWIAAAALLLPASLLHLWSYYAGAPDILVLSLIPMIVGVGFALAGSAGAGVLLFPALFLVLAIPPPAVLINQVIYPLQLLTSESVVWVLDRFGFTVVRYSDLILAQGKVFQVIENCSGMRSMETLAMAALLYSELFYRHRAQVVILLLSVPAISFLANQVRVLSIVLNPFSEIASDHTAQGILVVVGGVLALVLVDRILMRVLPEPRAGVPRPRVAKAVLLPEKSLLLLSAVFLTLAGISAIMPKWAPGDREGRTLSDFPLVLSGWKSKSKIVDGQFLGSVAFTERQSRTYSEPGGGEFDVFVGIDERYQRNFSLLSEKTALPGSGWTVEDRQQVRLAGVGVPVERLIVSTRGQRKLVYHWHRKVASLGQEAIRSVFALDRSFLRRAGRATVVRLSAPLSAEGSNLREVEARLQKFAPSVEEALVALEDRTWDRELRRKLAAPDGA